MERTPIKGERPFLENKAETEQNLKNSKQLEPYVNPIEKAKKFRVLLEKEKISQTQLAQNLGISRTRITQLLNLLKLSPEKQDYILLHGKEKMITEYKLRQISDYLDKIPALPGGCQK